MVEAAVCHLALYRHMSMHTHIHAHTHQTQALPAPDGRVRKQLCSPHFSARLRGQVHGVVAHQREVVQRVHEPAVRCITPRWPQVGVHMCSICGRFPKRGPSCPNNCAVPRAYGLCWCMDLCFGVPACGAVGLYDLQSQVSMISVEHPNPDPGPKSLALSQAAKEQPPNLLYFEVHLHRPLAKPFGIRTRHSANAFCRRGKCIAFHCAPDLTGISSAHLSVPMTSQGIAHLTVPVTSQGITHLTVPVTSQGCAHLTVPVTSKGVRSPHCARDLTGVRPKGNVHVARPYHHSVVVYQQQANLRVHRRAKHPLIAPLVCKANKKETCTRVQLAQ